MTKSQEKFIEHYIKAGDAVEAYKIAYPDSIRPKAGAQRLLRSPKIKDAITKRTINEIADKDEILRFWTSLLRDENADKNIRLEASKMLSSYDYYLSERDEY